MKIIQTLNSANDINTLRSELDLLNHKKINALRFNFCKFKNDEIRQGILNVKKSVSEYPTDYELFFDLPYPKNKSRIRSFSIPDGAIHSKERFIINKVCDSNVSKYKFHTISIETDDFFADQEILYFGDGEGAFRLLEYNKNYMVVEAINDFRIFLNKAILCGFINNSDYCKEIIEQIEKEFSGYTKGLFLSFTQTIREIEDLKQNNNLRDLSIYPKIELVSNCDSISSIIENNKGIVLARGDLGLLNINCTQENGHPYFRGTLSSGQ